MGVHTNNLQRFDQRKIVILEVTRTASLAVQIAGFYTQHFYVNIITGLALLITHYYCYYGRAYREQQTGLHMVYYQIYLTQIYFGIMCVIRKFFYVSFETIIVYLMSTVALTFMYMCFAKRPNTGDIINYYI